MGWLVGGWDSYVDGHAETKTVIRASLKRMEERGMTTGQGGRVTSVVGNFDPLRIVTDAANCCGRI